MSLYKRIRTGDDIDAYCTRCKIDLTHTVLALASENQAERVRCNTCGSEHRYIPERSSPRPYQPTSRPDARPTAEVSEPQRTIADMDPDELVSALRALLEASGATAPTRIGTKWEGGTIVLKPGREGLQEKEIPIDVFFKKIVMIRDRLRVLEQHVNSNDKLSDADKLGMQQYITRCYGSLTTFNMLFDNREDWFVGEKKSE
jgi:hypothetical protein